MNTDFLYLRVSVFICGYYLPFWLWLVHAWEKGDEEAVMPAMSQAEIEAFLTIPRHAIVGTINPDGAPHMSPVWYLYENGRLYISIPTKTVKYRNLKRDPRISVCIDGCRLDGRTVMFSGTAELLPKGDPFQAEMRWRIIRHYHDSEAEARSYAEQVKDVVSALIIVTPNRVISQNFN